MDLGQLEAVLLGVVKRQGRASSKDVWNEIKRKRKIAYNSIATTLARLYRKGLLKREPKIGRGGEKYIYFVKENQKLQKQVVNHFLDTLVVAFGPAVISSINEKLEEFEVEFEHY